MDINFKIHHIGLATRSIDKSIVDFEKLGYSKSDLFVDETQKVKIVFLNKDQEVMIELVEPISTDSPILNILSKTGTSAYHFCYLVHDIEIAIEHLKNFNYRLIVMPVCATAFSGKRVCFLYSINTGLIELLEN